MPKHKGMTHILRASYFQLLPGICDEVSKDLASVETINEADRG